MGYLAEHREVRVTARQSVGKLFIAPDLSPVKLVDRELEKGLQGWTDLDVKVTDLRGDHLPKGHAERQLEAMTVGTYIPRKVSRRELPSRRVRRSSLRG
ncbi:hypothetical protein PBI_MYXUS_100 [Mycobacterium phage Myxus]|uniref:Uncharacterized protein n=6 Tax=Fromanvirus TaxID=186764 RepID=G1BRA0_9CAUD|nr:hypothetical protein AVV05_gp009 [Mycobacterium phage Pioneer]YP_009636064.1 hypothetical protein FGG56_gp09 [Mycobacterium phage PackMan]AMO43968.1 hypothetical protein PBI_MYXUS_100 [Mycobacterium phage Myxus]AOQ29057.1 hypothetical protein SEA_HORTUMSL17_101 [Mycobacterium phage HortumSL17]AOY12020.1 hypothetical protein SEA_PHAEDER_100 [Mycobacterium phage Phaeder]AVI03806.1 hypothetical protein SEA_CONQUERAGE_97 [Mycobacterium phage Conquerage]AVI04237.1 hypothetical protein SEA_PHONN